MPTTPTLNGQVIGQAEHATRAVLDRLLARTGTTFHQWVALNLTAVSGGAADQAELIGQMTNGLKIDDSAVRATIAELTASKLLEARPGDGSRFALTDAGQARYRQIRTALDGITARLYGDLPAEDLATAGRVLAVVTARADAELAGPQPG
jgi:DNA-binding MarR family transcriptional regulator